MTYLLAYVAGLLTPGLIGLLVIIHYELFWDDIADRCPSPIPLNQAKPTPHRTDSQK